jgi:hypothetical protein
VSILIHCSNGRIDHLMNKERVPIGGNRRNGAGMYYLGVFHYQFLTV